MLHSLEAFQQIRRLQIKVLHHVDALFAGIYHSIFKGKGIEFEDVREYQLGDDIRSIDWNVTARSRTLYVKNFREERELTVMLVVDISASSHYSHTSQLKSELIAELAALISLSAIKNQDKVGLILFSEEIELYLQPKKGVHHVLRLIRELLYFRPKHKGTNLPKALSFLGKVQRRHVICFLISDFIAKADFSWEATLIAKRHELIAFQVYDSYEINGLRPALFELHDLEHPHNHATIDMIDEDIVHAFQEDAKNHQQTIANIFERIGIDFVTMTTDESSVDALQRFFRRRRKHR